MGGILIRFALAITMIGLSGSMLGSSKTIGRAQTPLACAEASTPTAAKRSDCATPTSSSDCSVTTPQKGEPANLRASSAPKDLPWVEAEDVTPGDVRIVGFLFYGDRQLPVGGTFSGGGVAKVLWVTNMDVYDFTLTALVHGDADSPAVNIEVKPALGTHREYPSIITLPERGCWVVTITASTEDGAAVSGKVVFEVVDRP